MSATLIQRGLEGVYVDETSISDVDGENGVLIYRDYPIEEVVKMSFVEVVHLVMCGKIPTRAEVSDVSQWLAANSDLSENEISILKNIAPGTHPMKVLQGIVPLLTLEGNGPSPAKFTEEARRGLVLAAKVPAVVANWYRIQTQQPILPSRTGLSFHENFLYRFHGRLPSPEQVKILYVTQVLQMEHGFNASTFAARVTASTLAPIECAVASAIGTLYGKLHGGADQAALEMGVAVGHPDHAEAFVRQTLQNKQKIMGMGHRIYRVVDPRAKILKPMARALCLGTPFETLYLTLEKIEEVMEHEMAQKGKRIKANVEFYKGPVFYALGFPPEYFTALFAMSRVFGYVAHVIESRHENRLIRPNAVYVPGGGRAE